MADTGFKNPAATGETYKEWTNPADAYTSNDAYATMGAAGEEQDYYNFGFGVPPGATSITFHVSIEACETAGGVEDYLDAFLSWNGGSSWTANAVSGDYGSSADNYRNLEYSDTCPSNYGRTWAVSELSNANFRLRLHLSGNTNQFRVDHVRIKVFYTGGSWGEGGAFLLNLV